ncbi:hypothetical protein ACI2K4_06655 [Micromonospora sp. NPDC050397]|uniref:hypothetical protein n=1 Tax=Micromonospora sp. NPDC050397 TaxID=3364279 RepID=UPI00384A6A5C
MRRGWASVTGTVVSASAAAFWAYALAVLQPSTEPAPPVEWAENNTYWSRDLRFVALIVVVLGLVLIARGDRVRSRLAIAIAIGAGWLVADVALDRVGVAGLPTAVLLGLVGGGVVLAFAWALRRDEPGGVGDDGRRPLIAAAAIGATLLPVTAGIESPTDTEATLTPSTLVVAALLLAVAVGCAAAAAPPPLARRRWALVVLVCLGGAAAVALRLIQPGERSLVGVLVCGLLVAGVALMSWDWPGGRPSPARHALVGLGALVGYPVLTVFTLVLTAFVLPVGRAMTALAGNPPVNAADTDALYSLCGLVTGVVLGAVLARIADEPFLTPPAKPSRSSPPTYTRHRAETVVRPRQHFTQVQAGHRWDSERDLPDGPA